MFLCNGEIIISQNKPVIVSILVLMDVPLQQENKMYEQAIAAEFQSLF